MRGVDGDKSYCWRGKGKGDLVSIKLRMVVWMRGRGWLGQGRDLEGGRDS